MKRTPKVQVSDGDEIRPHYDFDYKKARPNPYAARLTDRVVAIVLDPDVAEVFPTSESVN
jgi:hypothetical protein